MIESVEQYRKQRDLKSRWENTPHKRLGMSIEEYINHKNPQNYSELLEIIEQCDVFNLIEVLRINGKEGGPHYEGVRLKMTFSVGKVRYIPADGYIKIPSDYRMKDCKIILIDPNKKKKKDDSVRSIPGTDSE